MPAKISSPDEIRQRLAAHFAQRGFILPQQGMMAVAMPDFQDGYTKLYAALTQQENHFSVYEREFVWMGILSAAGESIGTHHVKLFRDHGGTTKQMEVITGLVALTMGIPARSNSCIAIGKSISRRWTLFRRTGTRLYAC